MVIVGHGPSILTGRGSVIDSFDLVVRLKHPPLTDAETHHWGARTDVICARSLVYKPKQGVFWHFNDPKKWVDYFREFSPAKPSTGLCAVFCAVDRGYTDIALIGFDAVLNPVKESGKWNGCPFVHDKTAEHRALLGLNI